MPPQCAIKDTPIFAEKIFDGCYEKIALIYSGGAILFGPGLAPHPGGLRLRVAPLVLHPTVAASSPKVARLALHPTVAAPSIKGRAVTPGNQKANAAQSKGEQSPRAIRRRAAHNLDWQRLALPRLLHPAEATQPQSEIVTDGEVSLSMYDLT